jgi:hypothetical protein
MQPKYKSGKVKDIDIFGYEVENLCTKEKNYSGATKSKNLLQEEIASYKTVILINPIAVVVP